ncbi:hypothetical protein D3C74_43490 [compost metagenome]
MIADLKVQIERQMKRIKADQALSSGEYKHYLTGQYDALDYVLMRLEVADDEIQHSETRE